MALPVPVWHAALDTLGFCQQLPRMVHVYSVMLARGPIPTLDTFHMLLRHAAEAGDTRSIQAIWAETLGLRVRPGALGYTLLSNAVAAAQRWRWRWPRALFAGLVVARARCRPREARA